MGKRGPPPKPTAVKVLEGNPGQRRLPANEPKPAAPPPSAAKPPAFLGEHGKAEWKRLYPVLRNAGLLTAADLTAFGVYCSLYQRWRAAEEALEDQAHLLRTPNKHVQPNPWVTISRQTAELMKAYLIQFGMTPASRANLADAGRPPPPGSEDTPRVGGKFAKLIGREK